VLLQLEGCSQILFKIIEPQNLKNSQPNSLQNPKSKKISMYKTKKSQILKDAARSSSKLVCFVNKQIFHSMMCQASSFNPLQF